MEAGQRLEAVGVMKKSLNVIPLLASLANYVTLVHTLPVCSFVMGDAIGTTAGRFHLQKVKGNVVIGQSVHTACSFLEQTVPSSGSHLAQAVVAVGLKPRGQAERS
jgi:hypothetical protein